MKMRIPSFMFVLLCGGALSAQSEALLAEVDVLKAEAAAAGLILLEEHHHDTRGGAGELIPAQFDQDFFAAGIVYTLVVVADCDCSVDLLATDEEGGSNNTYLTPHSPVKGLTVTRSDLPSATDFSGHIGVYVPVFTESAPGSYTYAMLFRRPSE